MVSTHLFFLTVALPASVLGDTFNTMLAIKSCSTSDPCKCKCIDLLGDKVENGTPIQLWDCDATAEGQKWSYERAGYPPRPAAGPIRLVKDPTKCIDVAGGIFKDGTALQLWDCNELSQQNWVVMGADSGAGSQISLKNGVQQDDFVIDIPGGNPTNGARLQIWDNANLPTQSWAHWQNDGVVPSKDGCPGPLRRRRGSTTARVMV
jgi:hypothetical protein